MNNSCLWQIVGFNHDGGIIHYVPGMIPSLLFGIKGYSQECSHFLKTF